MWLHTLCARPSAPTPGLHKEERAVSPWTGGAIRLLGGTGELPGLADADTGPGPMAALRKARRQEQLVSKRLLREDSAAREGAQDGADVVPDPLSEDEVKNMTFSVAVGVPGVFPSLSISLWIPRLDGSMRTLTGLFTSSLADLQLEAARCLHELSHSSVPAVAEACLPVTSYLLTYLSGHSLEFTELCLYTLGNLVVESEAVRKQLLPQGIIPVLASCIQSPHEAVLEGVGYVLSQLLQAKEAPTEIIPLVLDSVLPLHMLRLVCSGLKAGMGAAVEFAWCLHYIICRHEANTVLLELGAVPALTSLLLDLASEIPQDAPEGLELLVCPVLRCLSNLLAETGGQGQGRDGRLLIALFLILQCFLQQHPFLVQECLWLLNNLTGECSVTLSLSGMCPLCPPCLLSLPQVLTVLCNIAEQGPLQCQRLLCQPLLPQLLPVLALPNPEAVGHCLELLHLLFLHCPEVRAGGALGTGL
uniref:Transmembrane and coiled-coil domains 6 n=1 Tax=Malurus cyaneus samueli TaxID=2593467 RepID=A0A8C5U669_9PASS